MSGFVPALLLFFPFVLTRIPIMHRPNKRRNTRSRIPRDRRAARLGPWLGVIGVVMILWAVSNYPTLQEFYSARVLRNRNRHEVARLETQYQSLLTEQGELEAWGFSAEKAIRERFRMALPGEKIIVIVPPAEDEQPGSAARELFRTNSIEELAP